MGPSPCTRTSTGGSTASRKISSVPPDRHGWPTATRPSSSCGASASGVMRSSVESPVRSSRRPWARTVSVAQIPPTNPSMVPSDSTSARSPAFALVGRCARTTVASTYGSRPDRNEATLASRSRARPAPVPGD